MVKNFKLFNLTITNSKLIFDGIKKNTSNITELAAKIKNTLRIVHQFHTFKKKIVFVGNPLHINKQLSKMLKKTRHVFIPSSAWIAGHMTNKRARTTILRGKYSSIKLFSIHKLKRKSSLVVIIDKLQDSVALNEFHSSKTPIIALNSETKMLDETCLIKVPAKLVLLKSNLETFLFYSLLLKIFKHGRKKSQVLSIKRHLYLVKKAAEKKKRLDKSRWFRKRRGFHNRFGAPYKKNTSSINASRNRVGNTSPKHPSGPTSVRPPVKGHPHPSLTIKRGKGEVKEGASPKHPSGPTRNKAGNVK